MQYNHLLEVWLRPPILLFSQEPPYFSSNCSVHPTICTVSLSLFTHQLLPLLCVCSSSSCVFKCLFSLSDFLQLIPLFIILFILKYSLVLAVYIFGLKESFILIKEDVIKVWQRTNKLYYKLRDYTGMLNVSALDNHHIRLLSLEV